MELLDSFGTVVLVGNPKGDVVFDKNTYWKILRKQLVVTGSWNSSYNERVNDWKEIVLLMKDSDIPFEKLITKEFLLEDSKEAFDFIMNDKSNKFKVVFNNDK